MAITIDKGFILTSHWRDTNSGMELSYFGKSLSGPFKLVFSNQKLVFFVPSESKFNPSGVVFERKSPNLKSFNHKLCDAIYLNRYRDLATVKEYCLANSIQTFETDIRPTERFLMERFINGSIEFSGRGESLSELTVYENPEVRKTDIDIPLSVLSFDIETGVDGSLYSVGMHLESNGQTRQIVLMRSDGMEEDSDSLLYFSSEKQIIQKFLDLVRLWDPDIITGWHVIGFDLKFLEDKASKLGLSMNIGRQGTKLRISETKGLGFFADLMGRVVIDGPRVMRAAFYSFKNFKLETVASEVLGVGKDIASDGGKVSEIERRFKEDKPALAKYNLLDCTLVTDIYNKLGIIDLMVKRVKISGPLLDRLQVSTAAFDFMFLPKLHRRGYIAPNRLDFGREESSTGGMVIEPVAGLHENVAIFDFKSLYPSIIMTFKIDPFSLIQSNTNSLNTPIGIKFSKTEHILPEIIDGLMEQRQFAKDTGNANLSQSVKILMNSLYGVMGSTTCRFYNSELPSAITTTGHWILKLAMDFFKNRKLEVLYGDTDSIFVKLPKNDKKIAENITKDLDYLLAQTIQDEFGVKSHLVCEHEVTFDQIYFTKARSGVGAAKKRYASFTNGVLEFKGMEFVRSDWTELAKKFQFDLYTMFFSGMEVEDFIKGYIKKVENGEFDQDLIYTKRLSKAPSEYTKNIPVHVKAALQINHTGPYRLKEVSYVITKLGPAPVVTGLESFEFDYEHYIEKQLRPIANDILHAQDKDFDSFITGAQLTLF